jgi:hypothetical protein
MKKTKLCMLLAIIGGITFTFFSCGKPGNRNENMYLHIDFKSVDLGKLHNQVVHRVYERHARYVKTPPGGRLGEMPPQTTAEREREQIRVARDIAIAELRQTPFDATAIGLSNEQYYSIAIGIMDELAANDFDLRNFASPNCTPSVFHYVTEILNTIEGLNSAYEMNLAFDVIQSKASAELHGIELDEVTGILEIARGSAYLWSDENGLFNSGPERENARIMGGPKKVLLADVSASAGFFVRMGVMGVIFASAPGSNAVILTGWAISAGLSSALAGLYPNQARIPMPKL